MAKRYYFLFLLSVLLSGACDFKLKSFDEDTSAHSIEVFRYDRLESQYLTTGDFSALQQMNTDYPMETRTLIENILRIGQVDDPMINKKFLAFYQDSVLQTIISDAESQYADMSDINALLNKSFDNLKKHISSIPVPQIYAQIGSLDQSIVIGNRSIGISLDKYLGKDYPLYKKYYPESQLKTMSREYIVPDCLSFYLLSLYPLPDFDTRPQIDRDLHTGKIMWICNIVLEKSFFNNKYVNMVEKYMLKNNFIDIEVLLKTTDYSEIIRQNNV